MILVDTTVWVDHLRAHDKKLAELLDAGAVLMHPFVLGELALGHLNPRSTILHMLAQLPALGTVTDTEALAYIERNKLIALGIGYIDVHLLAAVQLAAGTTLWTRDKRLRTVAEKLGLAMP
jgi:predicted nucleic acid-binding protein